MTHLNELEAESIYILREVAAQFQRPAIRGNDFRLFFFPVSVCSRMAFRIVWRRKPGIF